MSLGCDWLRTGPTSDAQVSPALQAMAPSRERHIQEAEYCLLKSMGISPGPTCNTTATSNLKLGGNKRLDDFIVVYFYLYHKQQCQLCGNSSVTEDLDPVPLAPWRTQTVRTFKLNLKKTKTGNTASRLSPSLYSGSIFFFCVAPQRVSLEEVMKKASREEKKL